MATWVGYKTSVTNLVRPWLTLSESEVAQSCPTLCDPMGCSLPGSSVPGIFQARVLEWGATAFSIPYGSVPFSSVTQSCLTLCNLMNHSMPGLFVHHQCPEFTHSCPSSWWCHPAISSSVIPFSSCPQSLPTSGFFQWVNSLYEVANILEFQLQNQSFQWTPRTDLL